MKRKILVWLEVFLLLVLGWSYLNTGAWAFDVGWMQKGVRIWYLGGVDTGGVTSSNAEEAYLLAMVNGSNIQVTHHSALHHWSFPETVEAGTYQLSDKGPCWIHPLALQSLKAGDYWMGQEITLVTPTSYTYSTFPYSFLPTKALFDLKARQ